MPISGPLVAFAGAVALGGLMTNRCLTSPNPPPAKIQPDRMSPHHRHNHIVLTVIRVAFVIVGFLHAVVALTYPSPPLAMCPHPEHLNPHLFSWTVYTASCLIILFSAGALRMWTYAQLDKDFTFELAAPQRLVTIGLYSYVQHPSYATLVTVWSAFLFLYIRQKGVIGCWLPSVVVGWPGADVVVIVLWIGLWIINLWDRVKQEEAMLKKTFGKEWEIWHGRTRRFVPGLI